MLVAKGGGAATGFGGEFTGGAVVSSFLRSITLLLTIGSVLLPTPRSSTG
jgi:hypothetical protein